MTNPEECLTYCALCVVIIVIYWVYIEWCNSNQIQILSARIKRNESRLYECITLNDTSGFTGVAAEALDIAKTVRPNDTYSAVKNGGIVSQVLSLTAYDEEILKELSEHHLSTVNSAVSHVFNKEAIIAKLKAFKDSFITFLSSIQGNKAVKIAIYREIELFIKLLRSIINTKKNILCDYLKETFPASKFIKKPYKLVDLFLDLEILISNFILGNFCGESVFNIDAFEAYLYSIVDNILSNRNWERPVDDALTYIINKPLQLF